MSAPNGPYPLAYPPQPPRSGGSGTTIVAAVLAAVFVVATVIVAYVVHHPDKPQAASSGVSYAPSAAVGAPQVSGVPQVNGSDGVPSLAAPTYPTPTPLPSTSAIYTPPPLEPEAINRVFQVYMNALLYHDLSGLKSATCPQLRHTETGTALHHHYINRWKGKRYTIYPDQNYVRLSAVITQADTGVKQTYQWQVVRFRGTGRYWVCGFFG